MSTNKAPVDCLKSCSIPTNSISFHCQQDETEVCQWQTAQWLFIDCCWKRQGCKRRRQFLYVLELQWRLLFWMADLKKRWSFTVTNATQWNRLITVENGLLALTFSEVTVIMLTDSVVQLSKNVWYFHVSLFNFWFALHFVVFDFFFVSLYIKIFNRLKSH